MKTETLYINHGQPTSRVLFGMTGIVVVFSLLGYLGDTYLFNRNSSWPNYVSMIIFSLIPVYLIGSVLLRKRVELITMNTETKELEVHEGRPYGNAKQYLYSPVKLKMSVRIKSDPLKYISRFEKKEIRILTFEGDGKKSKLHTEILGASDAEFDRVINELKKNYPQHPI